MALTLALALLLTACGDPGTGPSDARTAAYVPNQVTPMGYGLGAQPDPAPGTLDYAQAQARIIEVERTHNLHGGPLDPARPPPIGAP